MGGWPATAGDSGKSLANAAPFACFDAPAVRATDEKCKFDAASGDLAPLLSPRTPEGSPRQFAPATSARSIAPADGGYAWRHKSRRVSARGLQRCSPLPAPQNEVARQAGLTRRAVDLWPRVSIRNCSDA